MRVLLLAALLVAVGFSGCTDSEYVSPDLPDTNSGDEPADNGNETHDNSTAEGNVTVDDNTTVEPDDEGGPTFVLDAPMNVTAGDSFDLSLAYFREGADPPQRNATDNSTEFDPTEGSSTYDDVFWSVTFDNGEFVSYQNGSRLPASFTVILDTVGNWTINATYEGHNERLETNHTIVVLSGAVEPVSESYSCSAGIAQGAASCTLATTDAEAEVAELSAGSGCIIEAGGAEAVAGARYPAGTEFVASCSSTTLDASSSLTLLLFR